MATAKRRRGLELEADILAATSDLLQTTKYADLTMDMIARNAHTNKSVLYRHWDDKAAIVMAAMRSQISTGDFSFKTPNTGSLRGDLISLFDTIMDRLEQLHFQNMMDLIVERAGSISIADYFQKLAHKNYLTIIVQKFFEQADDRGDRNSKVIAPYLYELPILLALDLIFSETDLTRANLHELVDTALMPVYRQYLNQDGDAHAE